MKQSLFTLLLLPFYCHAQIELGINGGVTPFSSNENTYGSGLQSKASSIYDATITYKIHLFKLGIGYSFNTVQRTYQYPVIVNNNSVTETNGYKNTYSNIYFLVDHELHIGRSYFTVGFSLGYVNDRSNSSYSNQASIFSSSAVSGSNETSSNGYSFGAHAAYSYRLYKGLCAHAQAGYNFTDTQPRYVLMLGIHYKFSLAKHIPLPPTHLKQ